MKLLILYIGNVFIDMDYYGIMLLYLNVKYTKVGDLMNFKSDKVEFIAGISMAVLSILSSIFTIIGTVMMVNGNTDKVMTIGLAMGIVCLIIFFSYKLYIQKKKHIEKIEKLSLNNKKQLEMVTDRINKSNADIKNELFKIYSHYKDEKLSQELLNESLLNITYKSVDSLSSVLSNLVGAQVHVCIKYFKKTENDIIKSMIGTMVRSPNTQAERLEINHDIEAEKVDDYIKIIKQCKNHFYLKTITENNYDNPHYYSKKFYLTKLVVPIRVNLFESVNRIEFKGFLCADCMNENAFEETFESCLNILQGRANNLYIFFAEYSKYSEKINLEKVVQGDETAQ